MSFEVSNVQVAEGRQPDSEEIDAFLEDLSSSGPRVLCRLGLALGSFTPWLQRPTEDDHFGLEMLMCFLLLRSARGSNQRQKRDQCPWVLLEQLDGKICFWPLRPLRRRFHMIPSPSSPKLWQRITTGWRWTHSAEALVLASSPRPRYRIPSMTFFLLQFLPLYRSTSIT